MWFHIEGTSLIYLNDIMGVSSQEKLAFIKVNFFLMGEK